MNNPNTPKQPFDFEETRTHILLAGRELLLAAQGALKFCSQYVDKTNTGSPNLKSFFKRAMTVADELSSGLKNVDAIKQAAGRAIKPIFTIMENEMAEEKKSQKGKTTKKFYLFYTTCPKCSKYYGKNHVIGFAEVA